MQDSKPGQILWHDLTVDNSENVSNFYHGVLEWENEGPSMGDYEDYMKNAEVCGSLIQNPAGAYMMLCK